MIPEVKLLRTWVTTGPCQSYLENIIQLAKSKQSSYVCFVSVSTLVTDYLQNQFRQVVNNADIVTILMQQQHNHTINQNQASQTDLVPDILKAAEKNNFSVFFYGSTQEVLNTVIEKVQKELPLLKIAGYFSPPLQTLSTEEDIKVTDIINVSGADLVFVSLDCSKQEKWMYEHKGQVQACMLGLGQAFITYAGIEKRLPNWVENLSLEWLWKTYNRLSFNLIGKKVELS